MSGFFCSEITIESVLYFSCNSMDKKQSNKERIVLEYDSENWIKVMSYIISMRVSIAEGKDIPINVAKGLKALLVDTTTKNNAIYKKKIESVKKLTIMRFAGDKHYKFNSKRKYAKEESFIGIRIMQIHQRGVTYERNLNSLLGWLFEELIIRYAHDPIIEKDICAHFIFERINHFIEKCLDKKSQKLMSNSKFKRFAITGFITRQLGFQVTNKINPSNKDLADAMKHPLNPQVKKKGSK